MLISSNGQTFCQSNIWASVRIIPGACTSEQTAPAALDQNRSDNSGGSSDDYSICFSCVQYHSSGLSGMWRKTWIRECVGFGLASKAVVIPVVHFPRLVFVS